MATAQELGVDSVLEIVTNLYGLEGTERGDEFDFLCPNPHHVDRKPSCGINLETGLWHCFSCGFAGDLARLGEVTMGLSREEVIDRLSPGSTDSLLTMVQRRLSSIKVRTTVHRKRIPRRYQRIDPHLTSGGGATELAERGFTLETLTKWGVQWIESEELEGKSGGFRIASTIAIPVRDERRHLHAWCYRRTNASPPWQPRYLYTTGVSLSGVWFGMDHHPQVDRIVVVEGALDAIWLDQAGIPALGLLGASSISEEKVLRLQRYPQVILLGDRDAAGAAAVQRIGTTLANRTHVRVARYPKWVKAKDPQELSPVDLELVVEKSLPWISFKGMSSKFL